MVNKVLSSHHTSDAPEIDEGWWRSLLLEENRWAQKSTTPKEEPLTTSPVQEKKQVDWTAVTQVYESDDIIEASVYSYNQGGLLLENDFLQGFVPISHLIATTTALAEGRLSPDWENDLDSPVLQSILGEYVGRTLSLKIIECNPERGRIVLSERAAQSGPGKRALLLANIKPGQRLKGPITNITRFGVFVDLGGLEGLIHISELSWGRVQYPGDVVQVGQEVEVYVLRVDHTTNHIALSLKRLQPNPWEKVEQRYQVGQYVDVQITTVVPFGAFARLEDGLDGLIHVSQMPSKGERTNPHQIVQKGDTITAQIIHIDPVNQRLGLSLLME